MSGARARSARALAVMGLAAMGLEAMALAPCGPTAARVVEEVWKVPMAIHDAAGRAVERDVVVTVMRDPSCERAPAKFVGTAPVGDTGHALMTLGLDRWRDEVTGFLADPTTATADR